MPYPVLQSQLALTSVATSANPGSVFTGTITGGGSNAYANCFALVAGFPTVANGSNNGTFLVLSSNATALVLATEYVVNATASATVTIFASLPSNVSPTNVNPYNASGSTGGAPPFGNPPSPGSLIVDPDLPSGASLTPRNFEGGWNYQNSELSSQRYTSQVVTALNDGVAFNNQPAVTPSTTVVYPQNVGGSIVNASASNVSSVVFTTTNSFQSGPIPGPSVGLKTDVQTTPSAPSGTYSSQGTPQISNAAAVATAMFGQSPSQISFVQWSGGYQNP